jgi:starvation-inducible DNA-binding protein
MISSTRIAKAEETAMYDTQHDLAENTRRQVVEILNARLAEAIDLQTQAKHAHWNVKGPHFLYLHELFDKLSSAMLEHIDEIAERATALGGKAEGTIATIGKRSKLAPYPLDITQGSDHVRQLAARLAAFGRAVRANIEDTAKLGDAGTSDLFTGTSRELDKLLWFLEAHLHAES